MRRKVDRSRQREEILKAVKTYSQSIKGHETVSLSDAVRDLRRRMPNLSMDDSSLAEVIAEVAFKKGRGIRRDLKSRQSL